VNPTKIPHKSLYIFENSDIIKVWKVSSEKELVKNGGEQKAEVVVYSITKNVNLPCMD
jgi:hypothetical protein